jgi:cyclopropane fatty-acyl-phospholipid synthase-like methyltransferase
LHGLNLYSQIEQYLEIDDEAKALHTTFKDIIDELKPNSLLDIGCGQGAFLETLELDNITTLGIDLSSSQIEVCTKKNLNVKCVDLCKINEKFDCATAIFDVINYIPKKNIRNFFTCVYKSLKKNGYFIFDINTLYGFEEVAQGALNIDMLDKFISIDAVYENKILETNITLFSSIKELYKKENGTIKQYYHSKDFLNKELKLCGFDIESAIEFKLHDVEEFDKQIFICKKEI